MEDLVQTVFPEEEKAKRNKRTQRGSMMPLIAAFLACFIGFMIYNVNKHVKSTDASYLLVSAEDTSRTAVILLATVPFNTTVPIEMPKKGSGRNTCTFGPNMA